MFNEINLFINLIVSILTFTITYLIIASRMKGKYRMTEDSIKCMKDRQIAENEIMSCLNKIDKRLEFVGKRLMFGNIVMRMLVNANDKISGDEIDKLAKDLGL